MYQARRAADPITSAPCTDAQRSAPRRATAAPASAFVKRVVPAGVSVALVATVGAFALTSRPAPLEAQGVPVRDEQVSRGAVRELLSAQVPQETVSSAPVAAAWSAQFGKVVATWYAQSDITVRALASTESASVATLKTRDKVEVTDRVEGDFRQVVVGTSVGWVPTSDVAKDAPAPGSGSGSVGKSPGKTSSTRVLGLTSQAMGVYNTVMGQWGGSINSVGGYRSSSLSDHQYGRAIDFMLTPGAESALGWTIAKYLAAHAAELGVDHIIFEQKIWTPRTPVWRAMASRGSITANHYDHVHVSVQK